MLLLIIPSESKRVKVNVWNVLNQQVGEKVNTESLLFIKSWKRLSRKLMCKNQCSY